MHKKFFLKLILFIAPLVLLFLSVNIKIDSAFVIHDRSQEIAKILISGRNAGIKFIPSNWGSLQTAIVDEQLKFPKTSRKDILVFGSSQSSEINSNIFPQNSFFNCVVPGCNILDIIALYGMYKQHEILPKYLIINISPFTFHKEKSIIVNNKKQINADISIPLKVKDGLLNEYKIGRNFLGLNQDIAEDLENNLYVWVCNFKNFFDLNYFQINIHSINSKLLIITDADTLPSFSYFVIRSDGSYSLGFQSKIDSNIVIKESNEFIENYKSNLFLPSDTNSKYFEYFKKLLINLKNDGVIPIVYFSPVNPIVYDNFSISKKVAIEDKIVFFCKKNGIHVIGSFNPHKYGYNKVGNFFIDTYHPVKSVVNKIFNYHRKELENIGIKINYNLNN